MTKNTDGGATVTTNFGDIEIEFYSKDAPKTVENFKQLAKKGFYSWFDIPQNCTGFRNTRRRPQYTRH